MEKEIQKVNTGCTRQRYSKEFKIAAVKLLQSGTKPGTLIGQINQINGVRLIKSMGSDSIDLDSIDLHCAR